MSDSIWGEVIKGLKNHYSDDEITTWIKPLKIQELRGDLITIEAPNRFSKNWVEDKYVEQIREILKEELTIEADIKVVIRGKQERESFRQETVSMPIPTGTIYTSNLNKDYTFKNYVEGDSNRFSYAACQAVSEGYFQNYNPLFIYGGVGLGKTHLMHAVGNKLIEKFPKLKVLYITSEAFTNEMINALKTKNMDSFRAKYRQIDMLLFDDVQFIAGKQRTTEEFFHTFNTLYDSQKQIILSSDKTPNEIPDLEERLSSRFSWGLIADIQPPSTEEKTAILIKRAEMMNLNLPDDVALFIAQHIITENVRELMGALIRLSAFSSFSNEQITIELARKSLDKFLIKKDRIVTSDDVINAVIGYFNIKLSDLKSKKRTKSISFPRQIAMYMLREKLDISLHEIGELFGGRDHSTVLHSIKSIAEKVHVDNEIKQIVEALEKNIYKG